MALDLPRVTLRRRAEPGELLTVELLPATDDRPQIVLEFEVPDTLAYTECEAIAKENLSLILRSPQVLARYGFPSATITQDQAMSLRDKVFLIEAACRFWKDTNADLKAHPRPADGRLTADFIAEMIHDPFISAAWHVHLTNAMALDSSEGNGSGASPSMSSGEAPTSAEVAPEPSPSDPAPPPAPRGSQPETPSSDGNAPASGSDPEPPSA